MFIDNKQKGVSLIMVFFIMIIILSVVLSVSIILYSEIKIMRNMGNSVVSFYAADSGIEKVLYYDRQVRASNDQECGPDSETNCPPGYVCDNGKCILARGFCSIFDSENNSFYCQMDPRHKPEHSIYCDSPRGSTDPLRPVPVGNPDGCNPSICDSCQIEFRTTLNDDNGIISYNTVAEVFQSGEDTALRISSRGFFGGTQREIQVLITPNQ